MSKKQKGLTMTDIIKQQTDEVIVTSFSFLWEIYIDKNNNHPSAPSVQLQLLTEIFVRAKTNLRMKQVLAEISRIASLDGFELKVKP